MPDAPAPTTASVVGSSLERPRLLGADHAAAEARAGQRPLHRAGREDHGLRGDLGAVEVAADLDVALVGHDAVALDDVDPVLLHQPRDAAGQRLDDLLAPRADGGEVDGRLADGDAEVAGLADLAEHVGDAQDRLGRDAGVVQAAPADPVGLDDRGLHAELRGADGGHVAARAGADDDAVVGALRHGRIEPIDVGAGRRRGRSGICRRAIGRTSFQNSQPSSPIATTGKIASHELCTPMRYSEKKTICSPRIVSKPSTAQYWRASMPKPATSSSAVVTAVATDGSPLAVEMSLPVSAAAALAIAKPNATIAAIVTIGGRSPGASGSRFARIARRARGRGRSRGASSRRRGGGASAAGGVRVGGGRGGAGRGRVGRAAALAATRAHRRLGFEGGAQRARGGAGVGGLGDRAHGRDPARAGGDDLVARCPRRSRRSRRTARGAWKAA